MANTRDIEGTKHTVEGLALMARKLGYKSRFGQLIFNNGATASDLFEFFEDNPGACVAVVEWVLENHDLSDEEEKGECEACGEDGPLDDENICASCASAQ